MAILQTIIIMQHNGLINNQEILKRYGYFIDEELHVTLSSFIRTSDLMIVNDLPAYD